MLVICVCYYLAGSYMLQPNIWFTLRGALVVFTRSAITPPKVKRFGWSLEHSDYIVGGLALVDFERDPRSSDSLRGRRIFIFFSSTKKIHDLIDRYRDENFRNRILKIYRKGSFYTTRTKFLTKFRRFATSGRHNHAVIADRRKFTTSLPLRDV